MSIKNCKHCDKQIDLDTDVEHEEVCGENEVTKVMCVICKKRLVYDSVGKCVVCNYFNMLGI